MTIFLDRWGVLTAGSIACQAPLIVGDEGMLAAAIARPATSVFGVDAYPTLWGKAAALLHSLALNRPFVDGNKRTAWAATWTFLAINGVRLAAGFDVDSAEALVLDTIKGALRADQIAQLLPAFAE